MEEDVAVVFVDVSWQAAVHDQAAYQQAPQHMWRRMTDGNRLLPEGAIL